MTPRFDVSFEVPPDIGSGLATGRYRLTGGVVRDVTDGQKIVRHIKEAHPSRGIDPVRLPSSLTSLAQVASVANLCVSVAGFALVLSKLGQIQGQLQALNEAVGRLEGQVAQVAAITKTIEKLGWVRLLGRVESALELAKRALALSRPDLATHLAAQALSKLSDTGRELSRLATDDELALSVRVACAQMALLATTATAALYSQLGEQAAAGDALKDVERTTSTLEQSTRVSFLQVPLALRFHPKLVEPHTSQTMQDLFGWDEAGLHDALATSWTEELGFPTSVEQVPRLLGDHDRLNRSMARSAMSGKLRFERERPLILATGFAARRSVELEQLAGSYVAQAEVGRRLGGGPLLWDQVDTPEPPPDAELVWLSVSRDGEHD